MNPYHVALLVGAPVVIWLAYFRWKDSVQPEPWGYTILTFALGICTAMLARWLYDFLFRLGLTVNPWELQGHPLMWYSLGVIGPVEEIAKSLPVILLLVHLTIFDEVTDGIYYASISALGFATYENAHYAAAGMLAGTPDLLWRALGGPFAHMAFACVWGYGIAKWKCRRGKKVRWIVLGYLFSFIAHGIYDYATLSGDWYRLFSAAMVFVIWIWVIAKWQDENERLLRAIETGVFSDLEIGSLEWARRRRAEAQAAREKADAK